MQSSLRFVRFTSKRTIELPDNKYNVVVAGAGIAGCIASKLIANKGYRVALVESKPTSTIGMKVCGDGVGLHEFHYAGVTPPTDEVERTVRGVKFYAGSQEPIFTIRGEGATLNRHVFGQRLLKEAQDAGVELFSESLATKALLEDGKVVGISTRGSKGAGTFRACVTIDATGIAAAVRNTLPTSWPAAERLEKTDIGLGYREYRQMAGEFEDYCSLYYDWEIAPGGYCWIIPKRDNLVNTGLLVPWNSSSTAELLRSKFRKFIQDNAALKKSTFVRSEIGLVPLRHPLPSAVADGFLAIGDAACHANPLNGDGIGPAMLSARIASDVATSCLSVDANSEDALWGFNLKYMKTQGYRYSANKVLSDFMRELEGDEVVVLLEALGTKEEYTSGDLLGELSNLDKLAMILRLATRPRFLFRLLTTVGRIYTVSSHCREYPADPSGYGQWLSNLNEKLQIKK